MKHSHIPLHQGDIQLITDKFVALNPLKVNIAIPLQGEYYHLNAKTSHTNDKETYPVSTPYDILVSAPYYPGFFYTYQRSALMLLLTLDRHFYEKHRPIRNYGEAKLLNNGSLKNKLLAAVGELCNEDINDMSDDEFMMIKLLELIHESFQLIPDDKEEPPMDLFDQIYEKLDHKSSMWKNLQDLIEEIGYSRSYVSSQFKQLTDMTLMDYIRLQRVHDAFNFLAKDYSKNFDKVYGNKAKNVKASLKLITNYTYKNLCKKLSPKVFIENPRYSTPFLDFVSYTNLLSTSLEHTDKVHHIKEEVVHIVEKDDMRRPFITPWKNMADVSAFHFSDNLDMARFVKEQVNGIGYRAYRFHVYYQNEGRLFIKDEEEFKEINHMTLFKILQQFTANARVLLNIDLFTLSAYSMKSLTREKISEFFQSFFYEQNGLYFFNLLNTMERENLCLEFSMGKLAEFPLSKKTKPMITFFKTVLDNLKKHLYNKDMDWGIHFSEVNNHQIISLIKVLEVFNKANCLPNFLSIELDDPEYLKDSESTEKTIKNYHELLLDIKHSMTILKEEWGLNIYLTHLYFYSHIDFSKKEFRDMFINTLLMETVALTSPIIDSIGRVTLKTENRNETPYLLINPDGFKTLNFHSLNLANELVGEIIYKDIHCWVTQQGNSTFVWFYSDSLRSCLHYENEKAYWSHKILLKDMPGHYKVTHYKTGRNYGNYHKILKRFQSEHFITDKEFKYIDSINLPYMENFNYESKDDILIETDLRPFELHFYQLEKYK